MTTIIYTRFLWVFFLAMVFGLSAGGAFAQGRAYLNLKLPRPTYLETLEQPSHEYVNVAPSKRFVFATDSGSTKQRVEAVYGFDANDDNGLSYEFLGLDMFAKVKYKGDASAVLLRHNPFGFKSTQSGIYVDRSGKFPEGLYRFFVYTRVFNLVDVELSLNSAGEYRVILLEDTNPFTSDKRDIILDPNLMLNLTIVTW